MITTKQLRQKFLDFFESKGHQVIAGASLIPENDPTVLFTTAGMHPLVPFLIGEKHPGGNRLVNYQKCIRTGDIDEVGDSTHLTFFEMLGNWSLGDPNQKDGIGEGYFKKQAIEYSWEFLTDRKWLGLVKEKIAVSVFAGDKDALRDDESAKIWRGLGLPDKKVAYLEKKDNWWGPAGQTGPCGPDTEIFYWTGKENAPDEFDPTNSLWVEIWNDVFMQYNRTQNGKYEPLKQKNVDTGMGLERTVAVLNGWDNVYEVDTLKPIYKEVLAFSQDKNNFKALRVITDHVRAAVMIMGDDQGVVPSNVDQGYVVRRLLRTAIRKGKELGIEGDFLKDIAHKVIAVMKYSYQELERNQQKIISEITIEEEKLKKAVILGTKIGDKLEKEFEEYMLKNNILPMEAHEHKSGSKVIVSNPFISGKDAYNLYSTYGIHPDDIVRLSKEKGYVLDEEAFFDELKNAQKKHQELSRQGAGQKFSGGLADHSDEVKKLHTATHLLHASLRKVLGDHVAQKGSNITAQRLRFDFSHPEKMTKEQLLQVENIVNEQINKKLRVWWQEMTVAEAKGKGALGLFTQKYGEKVKLYTVGEEDNFFSRELCGGPHVANTSELKHFKILKEEASSAGVRRIKAILK